MSVAKEADCVRVERQLGYCSERHHPLLCPTFDGLAVLTAAQAAEMQPELDRARGHSDTSLKLKEIL